MRPNRRWAFHAHVPKMAIATVVHRGHAVVALHVGTCEEIDPQTHFRTVERRLLDDRDGARVIGLHERSLVGGVAQIIAFQHRTASAGSNSAHTSRKAWSKRSYCWTKPSLRGFT